MNNLFALLIALGPSLLVLVGFVPSRWADSHPLFMLRLCKAVSLNALIAAIVTLLGFLATGVMAFGASGFAVYVDALSATLLLLVAFLGAIVIRYSANYLQGDAGQGRFMKWLAMAIGAVLTLLISGNLIVFTVAWMVTSLTLHRLLTFYPERPAAVMAARKKFIISRMGDVCLVLAVLGLYLIFDSLQFAEIFVAAEQLSATPLSTVNEIFLLVTSAFLVLGAALKSAQFPFHSWLPEVMETPTPVSALMHAGIINAGGFLIVRMSHVLVLTPSVLNVLALIGAITALFGAMAMLTQTSIKKSLAFSTVGQMGFMMLQCGLGAFSSAVLHIVAHSLYKAHAFLSSGSIVDIAKASWLPPVHSNRHPWQVLAAFGLALTLTYAVATIMGISAHEHPGILVLGAVLQLALTYLLWNAIENHRSGFLVLRTLVVATIVCIAYFGLQLVFMHWLEKALPLVVIHHGVFDWLLVGLVLLAFSLVLLLQVQFPGSPKNRFWQAAYVHFYNGFYLSTLANRWIRQYWPLSPQSHP
jgi:NAD(P)H-quinone oxidoreductase subunit 5